MRQPHSFDPATAVLLADGTTKPIGEVELGDRVAATDPATGTTTAGTVTALHANVDTDLTDVTVTNGDGDRTTIHTTQHHPFWDATADAWVNAADLIVGHQGLVRRGRRPYGAEAVRIYSDPLLLFEDLAPESPDLVRWTLR